MSSGVLLGSSSKYLQPAPATVNECQNVTFTASVQGTTNQQVIWSVMEGPIGGQISPFGVYTGANTTVVYHVVATSAADGSSFAAVPVVVTTKILGVSVSPATVTVPAGGSVQFTATVITTCGSFVSPVG